MSANVRLLTVNIWRNGIPRRGPWGLRGADRLQHPVALGSFPPFLAVVGDAVRGTGGFGSPPSPRGLPRMGLCHSRFATGASLGP